MHDSDAAFSVPEWYAISEQTGRTLMVVAGLHTPLSPLSEGDGRLGSYKQLCGDVARLSTRLADESDGDLPSEIASRSLFIEGVGDVTALEGLAQQGVAEWFTPRELQTPVEDPEYWAALSRLVFRVEQQIAGLGLLLDGFAGTYGDVPVWEQAQILQNDVGAVRDSVRTACRDVGYVGTFDVEFRAPEEGTVFW